MPIDLRLSDNQRYLIYEMSDPLDINALMQAYDEERRLRDSIPYTLHSIVDMSRVLRIPTNWLTAKVGPGFTHPRSGEILLVGLSNSLRVVINVILTIVNFRRVRIFASRVEADAYMDVLLNHDTGAMNAG